MKLPLAECGSGGLLASCSVVALRQAAKYILGVCIGGDLFPFITVGGHLVARIGIRRWR